MELKKFFQHSYLPKFCVFDDPKTLFDARNEIWHVNNIPHATMRSNMQNSYLWLQCQWIWAFLHIWSFGCVWHALRSSLKSEPKWNFLATWTMQIWRMQTCLLALPFLWKWFHDFLGFWHDCLCMHMHELIGCQNDAYWGRWTKIAIYVNIGDFWSLML